MPRGTRGLRDGSSLGARASCAWPCTPTHAAYLCESLCEAQQERRGRCRGDLRGGETSLDALRTDKNDGATIGPHDTSGSRFADPPTHYASQRPTWTLGRVRYYRGAGAAQIGETDCNCPGREGQALSDIARQVLKMIVSQIEDTQTRIAGLERQILAWHKNNPVSQRLATIPGIGPIIATAIAATVSDPGIFCSGREFAAWLGLVPRQHSTGGKARLGGISKRGDC